MVEAALDTRTIASNADLFSLDIAAYSSSGSDMFLGHSGITVDSRKSVFGSEKQRSDNGLSEYKDMYQQRGTLLQGLKSLVSATPAPQRFHDQRLFNIPRHHHHRAKASAV